MKLGTHVGLGSGHIVLDGDRAPHPPRRHSPQFWPMSIVAKKAGWIKMALGMEVCLGPGHFVLDGAQLPLPQNGQRPPIFGPFLCC